MKPIPERVEENKSPVESKALPHENVVIRCWKPDCRKVATCRDGSGWEWCDDHIDQEKTGSVLHTAQEYYDVDFYTERVRVCLTETDQQAREYCNAWIDPQKEMPEHNIQVLCAVQHFTTKRIVYDVLETKECDDAVWFDGDGEIDCWNWNVIGWKHIPTLSNPPSQV